MVGFMIHVEAVKRWFCDLYGISVPMDYSENYLIPQYVCLHDKMTREIFKFEQHQKREIQQKEKELYQVGHSVSREYEVTGDFKEYIRRIREEAHHP